MARPNKCIWVHEMTCFYPKAAPVELTKCEFCLKARQSWITLLKPVSQNFDETQRKVTQLEQELNAANKVISRT